MASFGLENTPITLTVSLLTVIFTALSRSTRTIELGICENLWYIYEYLNFCFQDVSQLLSGEFSRLFFSNLIYSSVAESLAGALVLFSFRQFERQMGSRKYGAFVFLCWIVATLLSLAFSTIGLSIGVNLTPSPGPYFFIFSQLAFYYSKYFICISSLTVS
jgi:membrane associated rhomboid family serine protease